MFTIARLFLLAAILLLAMACTAETEAPTATPRPTYTPYPTFTPIPTATLEPTAISRPTDTPAPTPAEMPTEIPEPAATPTATPHPAATPTPEPTHTPTPVPTATLRPLPTATPIPAPTATSKPLPTATPTPSPTETPMPTLRPTATPTLEPEEPEIIELGEKEYFSGLAWITLREAISLHEEGHYSEAIAKYKETRELHGSPSRVLENRIALAYTSLEEYDLAIVHYSNALGIEDSSINRVGRSRAYQSNGRCDRAIADAQIALTLEPFFDVGIHTDVEANYILSECYFLDEEYLLSLQHMEATIAIAKEHGYSEEELISYEEERAIITSYLE